MGQLAAGIVHDFNNVLQAFDSRVGMARRLMEWDPISARRQLNRAAGATIRDAAIADRLLSFARVGDPETEALVLVPLLDNIVELLRQMLGAAITVQAEALPDLPAFRADRGQLEAALINLASNARDAMPNGGALVLRGEVCRDPPPKAAWVRRRSPH